MKHGLTISFQPFPSALSPLLRDLNAILGKHIKTVNKVFSKHKLEEIKEELYFCLHKSKDVNSWLTGKDADAGKD